MIEELREIVQADAEATAARIDAAFTQRAVDWFTDRLDVCVYPQSAVLVSGRILWLCRRGPRKRLIVISAVGRAPDLPEAEAHETDLIDLREVPTHSAAATFVRESVPALAPRLIGLSRSFGFGDRLGIATPGHLRALGRARLAPILAQQSMRELARTGRSPRDVIDDATFGALQEGYLDGFGSDADHLKTPEDVDRCLDAGFTLFTFDPGDHVDDAADEDVPATLREKFDALPWEALRISPEDMRRHCVSGPTALPDGSRIDMDEDTFVRAAVKYGRAVAHVAVLFEHLRSRSGERPFEVEVSVDETATPTTAEEHLFIATQLRRLGVRWQSLAPRLVGEMEKGVDYKGDLETFEESFARHVAVAQLARPYKLSLHSGSDKFTIYPIAARLAGELLHVKTAGTSYLEALRALVQVAPELLREIAAVALDHYDEDRRTYHVSADAADVPLPEQLGDEKLSLYLDEPDARQVMHVTFGTILTLKDASGGFRFRDRLMDALRRHEEVYYRDLEKHLGKHVARLTQVEA